MKPLNWLFKFLKFILFYIYEITKANLNIARDILTLHPRMRPGIVEIPMDLKKDLSRVALANLISMTPGTLTLDISDDKKYLYVHVLYLSHPEDFRQELKQKMETKIREILE